MSLSALALNDGAVTVAWSFQAPIAAVWRGLTDPALLSRWLGTVVEIDIRTGEGWLSTMARDNCLAAR